MVVDSGVQEEVQELRARLYALQKQLQHVAHAEMLPPGRFPLLVCRTEQHQVALMVHSVDRVVPMAQLAPLPEAPPWVLGLLMLGKQSVPVLDVAARMARQARAMRLEDLIAVCKFAGRQVGLVVQQVVEIVEADAASIQPAAAELPCAPYLLGVLHTGTEPLLVLSLALLLQTSDVPAEEP